jgi:hypothetical protein
MKRAGPWIGGIVGVLLNAAGASGEEQQSDDPHYEIVTSKTSYSAAIDMSLYVEPYFSLKVVPSDKSDDASDLRILPAYQKWPVKPVAEEGYRYNLFVTGGVTIRVPKPKESEEGIDLGLATSAGTVAAMMLAPGGAGVVAVAGLALSVVEPLENIVREREPRLYLLDTQGRIRSTGAHPDSSDDLTVVLHMVEDHVMDLDADPILTRYVAGIVVAKFTEGLLFPEGPGGKIVAKTFDEAAAQETVSRLSEMAGSWEANVVLTGGGGGCPAPIAVPGFLSPMPIICTSGSNGLVALAPILSAPTVSIPVSVSAVAALPAPIAALPALRAVAPALAAAPATIEAASPTPGTVVLTFTPTTRPPPPPTARVTPPPPFRPAPAPTRSNSTPPPQTPPHTERWTGLPTHVTINGPINGKIDITRHQ